MHEIMQFSLHTVHVGQSAAVQSAHTYSFGAFVTATFAHLRWVHLLHSTHLIELLLAFLEHIGHRYLRAPGFSSTSPHLSSGVLRDLGAPARCSRSGDAGLVHSLPKNPIVDETGGVLFRRKSVATSFPPLLLLARRIRFLHASHKISQLSATNSFVKIEHKMPMKITLK